MDNVDVYLLKYKQTKKYLAGFLFKPGNRVRREYGQLETTEIEHQEMQADCRYVRDLQEYEGKIIYQTPPTMARLSFWSRSQLQA